MKKRTPPRFCSDGLFSIFPSYHIPTSYLLQFSSFIYRFKLHFLAHGVSVSIHHVYYTLPPLLPLARKSFVLRLGTSQVTDAYCMSSTLAHIVGIGYLASLEH